MSIDTDGKPERSFIIGIAGGSASGKTTFTAAFVQGLTIGVPSLRVEVVGIDRYFYRGAPGGALFTSPSTGETLPNNNHPDSADNARLVKDLDALCIASDRPDVIIVEGLMTLHIKEIRRRCDLRLFIELEDDIRALRRMLRDMTGVRGNPDPKFIATYYQECARVGHSLYVEPSRVHADIILRGDSDFSRTAPMIAMLVRRAI